MHPFKIDTDIRRAETLPGAVYHDAACYDLARQRIFAHSWHYVGDARRIRAPGHVLPVDVLPGCLDEPLVLTVSDDGMLNCLSNVCTHRGTIVVEGEGHVRGLRCRYHGRRFHLDGRFVSMPEFEGVEDFPSERDNLPRLPLHQFGPLLFTALDPAIPYEEWMAPVLRRVAWLDLERLEFDAATSHDYFINANWALYCDNYLEEFHIPYVHATSLTGLDYAGYRTETYDYGSLQLGVAGESESVFELPADHPDAGERMAAFYFWLFPNLMLNFYPWGLSMNVVQPLGPERTKVSFRSYVLDASKRHGVGGDLNRVEMEDEEVVEAAQKGVRSRLYNRGRYSPRREVGTHHFHTLLARFLNG
ncbi:MAG TPA: aromatic ring-hydroxylating dioxygenase subunit alpha [Longimicrobiales bacterium]